MRIFRRSKLPTPHQDWSVPVNPPGVVHQAVTDGEFEQALGEEIVRRIVAQEIAALRLKIKSDVQTAMQEVVDRAFVGSHVVDNTVHIYEPITQETLDLLKRYIASFADDASRQAEEPVISGDISPSPLQVQEPAAVPPSPAAGAKTSPTELPGEPALSDVESGRESAPAPPLLARGPGGKFAARRPEAGKS